MPVTTSAQSGGKRPPVVGTAHPTTGQRGGCIFRVLVSTCATSALVDTGSPVSFLSHRYFQKVASVAHNVANIRNEFRAVNNSKFACDLCCDIVIVIDGREVKCHFFVSKALCDFDMILGRSFLQTGFTLTFTQEEVSLTSHPPSHTTTKGQATDSDTNPVTCSLTQPNPLRIGQGQNNVCPQTGDVDSATRKLPTKYSLDFPVALHTLDAQRFGELLRKNRDIFAMNATDK